jgi:CHAT domain-containing protein
MHQIILLPHRNTFLVGLVRSRFGIVAIACFFVALILGKSARAEVPSWQCVALADKNACAQSENVCGWDGTNCLPRNMSFCWDECLAAKRPRQSCDAACPIASKPFHPKTQTKRPVDVPAKIVAGPLSETETASIATQVARLTKSDFWERDQFVTLGHDFMKRGRLVAAEALYKRLLEIADYSPNDYLGWYSPPLWRLPGRMTNQISFVLEVAYPELTKILVAQGKNEEALEFVARGRSRLLEAVIQRKTLGSASVGKFSAGGLAKARQLAKELEATIIVYAVMSLHDDQRNAEADTIWAWVIQENGNVHRETLPFHLLGRIDPKDGTSPFTQLIMAFHDTIPRGIVDRITRTRSQQAKGSKAGRSDYLRTLHQVLIAPLQRYLPKDAERKVIIVPDGNLFMVPFGALVDGGDKHLVDLHTLSVAPSIGVVALLHDSQKGKRPLVWQPVPSALIVGDPKMPSIPKGSELSGQLTQLAGADQEAKTIADLLKVQPLLGSEAREHIIVDRMRKARVIHFATHGLLSFESILTIGQISGSASVDLPPGAIVLAASPGVKGLPTKIGYELPYNGFLASGKILMLDLVTLSACDTARGRTDQHQFAGLPTALLAAGARTVVMTLWAIPDAPTSELMVTFYKELVAGRSKAAALRYAVLATKARYPDLENWGAFTLLGLPN